MSLTSTSATKLSLFALSLFARCMALLTAFSSMTGKPNGIQRPPRADAGEENYAAYLPLFVP